MREAILTIKLDRDASGIRGNNVRKTICALFPDNPLLSNHDEKGDTINRYPLVQYRTLRNSGITIYGINEGADTVYDIYRQLPPVLKIGIEYKNSESLISYGVAGKIIRQSESPDKLLGGKALYRTITPIVLIDRNDRETAYKASDNKPELLKKWLINNMVHTAYNLGMKPDVKIDIPYLAFNEVPIKKKGVNMIGLKGEFMTNMRIGNLGVGHFTSHGFGVVQAAA